MSRKSVVLAVFIVLVLAGGAGAGVAALWRHEPAFYVRSAVPEGPERARLSGAFSSQFAAVAAGIVNQNEWNGYFTQNQLNSYFVEEFVKAHTLGDGVLPDGVREPRVAFEDDVIRLGFRYGTGSWSTVVSVSLRAWIVPVEPNVVALEFLSLHAGGLPISAQTLLERVSESARQHDMDVTWYRNNSHPVVLVRFQAHRATPTFQLKALSVQTGVLRVQGRAIKAAQ